LKQINQRIISIDIETKQVTSLENGIEKMNSLECLRFSNDWICGNLQGYNRRPSLVIGKLPQRGSESRIQWKIVEIQDNLNEKATVELITHLPKVEDSNYRNISFESILVESTQKNNGLVVFPHGGPHGAFCCEFSAHVAIFYSLGFSVLLVNYRGSAGFGQDSIDCLPGKVGTNDVNDVQVCKTQFI
jgi:acylaminoacyl-peptidase